MSSTQSTTPFSRLRTYSRELYALDAKPLIDRSFSFPWEALGKALGNVFGCHFRLAPGSLEWRAELYAGLIAPHLTVPIGVPGIEGQIQLVISRADVETVMAKALHVDPAILLVEEPQFFDTFAAFFSLELLACAQGLEELKTLAPRLTTKGELVGAGCLCQDIEIAIDEQRALARLLIPPHFLDSWKSFRLEKGAPQLFPDADVHVQVEAGRLWMKPEELASLAAGDVLLVEHPFYTPGSKRARVYITYNGRPLYRAKIEDGSIKILEMPTQHEAFLPTGGFSMTTAPHPDSEHQEDDLGDEPFESADDTAEGEAGETTPPQSTTEDQEDGPGEDPFESVDDAPEGEASKMALPQTTAIIQEPLKIEDVPLPVVIQLAQLTLPVGQLASLQPGNLLDLDIQPEDGVSLVVNGRVVGQGELVLIGDNVGVRIKEIGISL